MEQMHARVGLAAIAAGLLMVVPPALAQGGAQGGSRVREPARVCAGDCPEERAEALRELGRARTELERLARMLAQRGDSLDARQLAETRARLIETLSRIEQLERRSIREQESRVMVARLRTPSPTISQSGWLGVSFSSNFEVVENPGQPRLFRFMAYPVVEAVEPASPARRAGIEVGDVLLAFQQKDLRKEPIALDALLTPGRRLPVLLKRGEDTRTVTVVVGERPRGAYAVLEPAVAPVPPPRGVLRVPTTGAVPPAPAPSAAPRPPAIPEPRVWVYAPSQERISLAGAELARLPEQLREQVGASGGLLVLLVAHGTPAARAGLRSGDVIVRADGEPVASSGELQAAFRRADNRAMLLQVVRQRETMTVRMTW
ncbi:MAG TPA: PDZ domain-containing protein [Gemmatimonadaceae bacterium]|nr:PDZ domain-containing protein [Gemmatimonadaceae bacterium]